MLTGEPWVRWPPAARLSPMKVSPGCISAMNAAALAEAPECGCTLAKPQPNSLVTRSIASRSAMSTILAAAVVALARQAFGIFVGQHRALRLEHGAADDVFRRDQLDLVALAAELEPDRLGDFGIGLGQRGGKQAFVRRLGALGYRHASCLAEMGGCPQLIHPAPASYQPMSARHGIFQRITPLHLGIWSRT